MRNLVISLVMLAALLLAAPAAPAGERYPLRKDLPPHLPEFLPDDAFGWSGNLRPFWAGVLGGLDSPYRDTYGEYTVHLGCDQRFSYYTFVDFRFPRRWSRVHEGERPAGGGEGYLLRHDVELYERSIRIFAHSVPKWNKIGIKGPAAPDLIRKIHCADSITWTDVETATTSPAFPVSEEMRATIGRVMEACGISHEPPPATPTAAPDRPAPRP